MQSRGCMLALPTRGQIPIGHGDLLLLFVLSTLECHTNNDLGSKQTKRWPFKLFTKHKWYDTQHSSKIMKNFKEKIKSLERKIQEHQTNMT